MSDGQVLEFDRPLALLHNKNSEFFRMVSKAGTDASRNLYQMALEADTHRRTGNMAHITAADSHQVIFVTEV